MVEPKLALEPFRLDSTRLEKIRACVDRMAQRAALSQARGEKA